MRGIILAGGSGTRLYPLTISTSKQLLPVFDKPLIYYPLSTLMEFGIRDILVITTESQMFQFKKLLGDGSAWGLNFTFIAQASPNGIAEALVLGEEFISGEPVALILGDNLFLPPEGSNLTHWERHQGATVFLKKVDNAKRFGVAEIDSSGKILSLEEKPVNPKSDFAMTGLYFFDNRACGFASTLEPSDRGELEIVDLVKIYLALNEVKAVGLQEEVIWCDSGDADSLMGAAKYVQQRQNKTSNLIGSPEEVAYRKGWISESQLLFLTLELQNSAYGKKLLHIIGKD